MQIYLAGNTPDREREEYVLLSKNLTKRRLVSYFYIKEDKAIRTMYKLWKNEIIYGRRSRRWNKRDV